MQERGKSGMSPANEAMSNAHDQHLPKWGPYTKKYIGISHIADFSRGIRFDLSVFPAFYRGGVQVPNVLWESGFHPWEASPDLEYVSFRHELLWKDRVYSDISFVRLAEDQILIRCECVNQTEVRQHIALHFMASLHVPQIGPHAETLRVSTVDAPPGSVWKDALDYEELAYAKPRPADHLVYDGFYRGEVRMHGFVGGSGLGKGFGADAGDRAAYRFAVDAAITDAVLLLRYRMDEGASGKFRLTGLTDGVIEFKGTGAIELMELPLGQLKSGEHGLSLISAGGASVEIDGLLLAERKHAASVRFPETVWNPVPGIMPGLNPNSLLLSYDQAEACYGVAWEYDSYEIRQFHSDELDTLLRHNTHHHTKNEYFGNRKGHYTNIFMRPIVLQPRSKTVLYGFVCSGGPERIAESLAAFGADPAWREKAYGAARSRVPELAANPEGETYRFSQQRMAAILTTNIVFPVYTKRSYIRHYTPGRWWDSLYTWDSGFIGLGLAELDPERAENCLRAYVTEPGDPHAAFIHHGSLVPVQHYLFLELWNKTQSGKLLADFYPRLKQYYLFLAGELGNSTTRMAASHLIRPWDYFYNSGGWDDYPPQVHVHRNRLQRHVAPVSNTAHCIRIAKILRMAACALRLGEDAEKYERDIALFTEALQQYAWDEESGYFGYVCHDDEGMPAGILRTGNGENFNKGMDGAYPLAAGICTPAQERRLLGHLFDEKRMWSPIGLSAVDRSASYYRDDGYWNGTVWMPHQWFYWKTMLDLGKPELASRIAGTALDLWKREVEESYHCFEHFVIASGRGAGWHQFGGLSAPVLSWYSAYHRAGRLTCGLDVWVTHCSFAGDHTSLNARLLHYGKPAQTFSLLAAMNPKYEYEVLWNGELAAFHSLGAGTLSILVQSAAGNAENRLNIRRIGHGKECARG
jgi:hypothetical protein